MKGWRLEKEKNVLLLASLEAPAVVLWTVSETDLAALLEYRSAMCLLDKAR